MLSREWKCSRSSADRRCSNYIWMINNLITHCGASYIRGLTVVLPVTFLIFFAICGGVCVKLAQSSLCDREDILIIRLNIIRSEVSAFFIVVILFRGYVPEVVVTAYVVCTIYFPGFLCISLLCNLMMCANNRVHYDPMGVLVCLHIALPHYHHYADISRGIELLKCLSDTFCIECVSKIKSILSIIFSSNIWDCAYSAYPCLWWWSYYYDKIESMTHLPLFRVRSGNDGMRCMHFYIQIVCVNCDSKYHSRIDSPKVSRSCPLIVWNHTQMSLNRWFVT